MDIEPAFGAIGAFGNRIETFGEGLRGLRFRFGFGGEGRLWGGKACGLRRSVFFGLKLVLHGGFRDLGRAGLPRIVLRTAYREIGRRVNFQPAFFRNARFGLRNERISCIIPVMDYRNIITIEPDKRFGKPCVRGMRITVYDVLSYLASGMTQEEILDNYPELTREDILACLSYAADRESATRIAT